MKNWRGIFLVLLIPAFIGLEVMNYATSETALNSLLPGMEFWGYSWATLLAIALCATDFTGLARIFTPEQGKEEPVEVKILTWGWLMAAVFNAILSWWGILEAMSRAPMVATTIAREDILTAAPLGVAFLLFTIRICVVLTLSFSLDHLINGDGKKKPVPVNPKPQGQPQPPVQQTPRQQPMPEPAYSPRTPQGQAEMQKKGKEDAFRQWVEATKGKDRGINGG